MNLFLEIADVIFLAGVIFVSYTTNKRVQGSWWKISLFALFVGGGIGFGLSKLFPLFDADFFPLGLSFVFSVLARRYFIHKQTARHW